MKNSVNDKENITMSENYKIHKAWIKEAEFEILVLEIPKNEIEDKLAYLARDKGSINRSFYEDYVIATCVANINQLLFHIKQQANLPPSLMQVREEVMTQVIFFNPLLNPDNLVINRNSVIKLKSTDILSEEERPLTENKQWNVSYYDDVNEQEPEDTIESIPEDTKKVKKELPSELKNIEDIEFTVVKQWWKRINRYVEVKKFNEQDAASILSHKFFHNRSSFQTYVVTVCVVDSEDLFIMLDNMGLPNRVAPPILMHEVYLLAHDANPFLTYENAQNMSDNSEESEDDEPQNKRNQPPNRMSSHAGQQNSKKKKKHKKTFKDVSKDDLLKLNDTMKVFVIGQDSAVDQIVEAVQRASVGLKDPIKPIGSFLFAGSTGIGKSLTTKILADELIKDRDNLVTIDCSEFSSDHEYSKLIGCFVPGTKVLMESGERKNIETINIGDKVITHKGRSRNVEFVHEYDQKGEMIEITTVNSNISETMTKTHEVLAIKSKTNLDNKQFNVNNLKWVQAKDLIAGDTLVYPVCQVTEEYLKNTNLYEYADENYIYKQIKKIDIINYTGKVYDLAVEEDVSYVLDFIVHNSPNGYIGFEQGGTLTNAVMENPFSVVVFDEIEKASHKVHELLLQILEEGRLTDGKGQKVSFKDTIVIMTSNIGVSEVDDVKKTIGFGDVAKVTDDKKTKAIEKAIKKKFKPEFLNRIDSIVHFNSLSKQDYIRIIDIELYKLNENLKNNDTEFKDLTLKFDKKIKSYILKHGIDEDFGARPLKRCIEKEIATPLALKLLRDAIPLDATVLVSVLQSKVAFYIKDVEVIKKSEVHKELVSLTAN